MVKFFFNRANLLSVGETLDVRNTHFYWQTVHVGNLRIQLSIGGQAMAMGTEQSEKAKARRTSKEERESIRFDSIRLDSTRFDSTRFDSIRFSWIGLDLTTLPLKDKKSSNKK